MVLLNLVVKVICLVSVFSISESHHLPSFIKTCKIRSPDFSECAVKNGNEAIPHIIAGDKTFGIPSFDPLTLPLVEFASGELRLTGRNVVIHGIPGVRMTGMKVNLEKNMASINLTNKNVELDFIYDIGGKLSSLPIEGHGDGKIKIQDAAYNYEFEFRLHEVKGKHHIEITSDELDVVPQKFFIKMENLFNGNKLLGDNMNKFLNENWQEILVELKPAINEIVGSIVKRTVDTLFKRVPLQEIFPDY